MRRSDEASLIALRNSLLVRVDRMYTKHYVPRLAAWALLKRGSTGVAVLAELGADPATSGAIYPQAIIESLWAASKGEWTLLLTAASEDCGGIDLAPPDGNTIEAARRAIDNLFAELPLNPVLFDRLFSIMGNSRTVPGMSRSHGTRSLKGSLGQRSS